MRALWFLILAAAAASGETVAVPTSVVQGNVIPIEVSAPATSARMLDRTIQLFGQRGGDRFGLMPVPATQAPGVYPLELLDGNGAILRTLDVTVEDAHFEKQDVTIKPKLLRLRPKRGERKKLAAFRQIVSEVRYWHEPFALPVPGCMTSPFGSQRFYNGKPGGNYHSGLDQRADAGEPVHAIAGGKVRLVGAFTVPGRVVGIDHGQGLLSLYQHLSRFAVAPGAVVKQNDVIGYAGSTGRSNAPHLHWTILANGVPTNPLQWVRWTACETNRENPRRSHGRRRS